MAVLTSVYTSKHTFFFLFSAALGLERDLLCFTFTTVCEHVRDWSTALPLTLLLPLSSFPGAAWEEGKREGDGSMLVCESPELPQPAPHHLSLTSCVQTDVAEGKAVLLTGPLPPLGSVFVRVHACLSVSVWSLPLSYLCVRFIWSGEEGNACPQSMEL